MLAKKALDFAVSTAREAGKILMDSFGKDIAVELKGEIDPITELDRRVEEFVTNRVRETFPGHELLAEEGTRTKGDSEFRWIIDPIDGTTNYAHGYPCFTVSIALEQNETGIMGVIYNPPLNEMFTTVRGKGAFLNGEQVHVSNRVEDIMKSYLVMGVPYNLRDPEVFARNMKYIEKFLGNSFALRRDGSAAFDLACIAAGRFDGFWEEGLKSWDTAAGIQLIREAGGIVTDHQGNEFIHSESYTILTAANRKLHEQMLEFLN